MTCIAEPRRYGRTRNGERQTQGSSAPSLSRRNSAAHCHEAAITELRNTLKEAGCQDNASPNRKGSWLIQPLRGGKCSGKIDQSVTSHHPELQRWTKMLCLASTSTLNHTTTTTPTSTNPSSDPKQQTSGSSRVNERATVLAVCRSLRGNG